MMTGTAAMLVLPVGAAGVAAPQPVMRQKAPARMVRVSQTLSKHMPPLKKSETRFNSTSGFHRSGPGHPAVSQLPGPINADLGTSTKVR